MKDRTKRYASLLAVAFICITTGLTASSRYLHNTVVANLDTEPSSKAIIKTDDASFEQSLANEEKEYTKIGNNVYVVDYKSEGAVTQAVYQDYEGNDKVQISEDAGFMVAGPVTGDVRTSGYKKEKVSEGQSLREYADKNNKKLVAVIDTGVNDLAVQEKNFTDEETASDRNGHGTAMAKTILDNSNGDAIILSLKAMADDGTGYSSDIMEAVQYALDQKVDAINLSLVAYDTGNYKVFKDFMAEAAERTMIVAAAGNYNSSVVNYIPANIDKVVSVGALGSDNKKLNTSNYGADYYERASSTSEAAAIFTGKYIANGKEIDKDTVKDEEVSYDSDKVDSSLLSPVGTSYSKDEKGNPVASFTYGVNMDPDIRAEIAKTDAKYFLSTTEDSSDHIGKYLNSFYDRKYNSYHYTFRNKADFSAAMEATKKNDFVYGNKINNDFKVSWEQQSHTNPIYGYPWQDGSRVGYWTFHFMGSASKCHVDLQTDLYSDGAVSAYANPGDYIAVDFYHETGGLKKLNSQQIHTTSYDRIVPDIVESGPNAHPGNAKQVMLASGGYTDTGHDVKYKVELDMGPAHWSHFNNGGPQKIALWVEHLYPGYVFDVNFFDPAGTNTGGSGTVGTADVVLTQDPSWREERHGVNDFRVQGWWDYTYSVSNIKLLPGLKLKNVENQTGQRVFKSTDVNIRTDYATLNVNPNGGTLNGHTSTFPIKCDRTNATTTLGTPTRTGYIFTGWQLQGNVGSLSGNTYTYGNDDATVVAQWKRADYSLNVDGNTGTINGQPQTTYKVTLNTPKQNHIDASAYHKTGYQFDGVYTSPTGGTAIYDKNGNAVRGTQYWDGSGNWVHEGNMTLYAHWKENNYTIHYDGNRSTGGNTPDQHVTYTQRVNLSRNGFTKTGYKFKNWTDQRDGGRSYREGQEVSKLTEQNNATVTFYAKWEPIRYRIEFDANGGRHVRAGQNIPFDQYTNETDQRVKGSMASIDATYDQPQNLKPTTMTWEGHTFLGWSTDPHASTPMIRDGGQALNLTTEDGKTVTLYAVWQADRHPVTIDPVSGDGSWKGHSGITQVNNGNVYWGDKLDIGSATPAARRATITYDKQAEDAVIDRTSDTVDWTFNKWIVNKDARGKIFNNVSQQTDNCYYVVQDTDDTLKATYYFASVILPTPTRDGYNFLGWYLDPDCTRKATDKEGGTGNGGTVYHPSSDVTLYARWEKQRYNYADTMQAYMQDKDGPSNHQTQVFIRKVDASTGEPLTVVNGEGFVIGVYQGSVSGNPVLTLDTARGILDNNGRLVIDKSQADERGFFDVTSMLSTDVPYIAHEISAASEYLKDNDQSFTVQKNKRISITMKDQKSNVPKDKFFKMDEFNRPVKNAVFSLKDETTSQIIGTLHNALSTDKNGYLNTKELLKVCVAGHRYSLTEVNVPDGYKAAPVTYFTMPEYNGEEFPKIVIEEPVKKPGALEVMKVDPDDKPLRGAVFGLYMKDKDGELIPCYMNKDTHEWVNADEPSPEIVPMIETTGADGIASFHGLPLRASYTGSEPDFTKSYYLKEIAAPEGYNPLPEIAEVRLPDDGDGRLIRYTVKDDSVVLTLETGGNGNFIYYGAGAVLIVMAMCLMMKKRLAK